MIALAKVPSGTTIIPSDTSTGSKQSSDIIPQDDTPPFTLDRSPTFIGPLPNNKISCDNMATWIILSLLITSVAVTVLASIALSGINVKLFGATISTNIASWTLLGSGSLTLILSAAFIRERIHMREKSLTRQLLKNQLAKFIERERLAGNISPKSSGSSKSCSVQEIDAMSPNAIQKILLPQPDPKTLRKVNLKELKNSSQKVLFAASIITTVIGILMSTGVLLIANPFTFTAFVTVGSGLAVLTTIVAIRCIKYSLKTIYPKPTI